ncbi:zinc finger bed domain-containing protein 1-like [Gigaspora margarita]|uniref:Zinc finger bed domain-containing protein 1-like n=1 Tax=Gigaspora margarita TaxID=4874 RepID=A0A8H4AA46_GIGMA|nr:zinc finger bed domain-containing protein 1-like [Gigaspora margarita]
MPRERGDYWDNYDEVIVNGKVRFKCKLGCGGIWAKNETRLKEHSENCSKQPRASNNNQTTLDNYVKVVPRQSQNVYNILLTRAFISSELVLKELANYIGKTGPFSSTHLWGKLKEDPIEWWNLVSNRAPNLSEVALKVFSIPASSASSERNWSTFGFIYSKNRNRLDDKRVKKLVYLYWNLRILRQLNQPIDYNYDDLESIKETAGTNIKETTNTTETINVEEDINIEKTNDETYNDLNLFYDLELDEANKSLDNLWEDSENSNKDMDYLVSDI